MKNFKNSRVILCFIIIGFLDCSHALIKTQSGEIAPRAVIENFYKSYFAELSHHNTPKFEPPLSSSFKKLSNKNHATCKQYAGSDVCGWDADMNPYLGSQEYDSNLNFSNTGFSISEHKLGKIIVRMNVYPSAKDSKKFYNSEICYQMIQENHKWVVNDITWKTSRKSAKQIMKEEIEYYTSRAKSASR